MLSKIKHLKSGHLQLYYSRHGRAIRKKLSPPLDVKHLTKDLLVKQSSGIKNYEQLNQHILNQCKLLDSLILEYTNKGLEPDVQAIKFKLFRRDQNPAAAERTIPELYDEYMQFKRNGKVTPGSLKTYQSFSSHFKDFEDDLGQPLYPKLFTAELIQAFEKWMSMKRSRNQRTEGGLNSNSIARKFKGFRTFWRWMVKKGYTVHNEELYQYKIQTYKTDFVALNDNEIEMIKNHQYRIPSHQKAVDIMLFLCYTGMRWSDYEQLEASHFIDRNMNSQPANIFETQLGGDIYINKVSKKTKIRFVVPLHPYVRRILNTHQCIPKMTGQAFNRSIKEALKEIPYFHQNKLIRRESFGKVEFTEKPLYSLISSHCGRHTAATRWLKGGVPHNIILGWMGWSNPSMIFYYAEKLGNNDSDYMSRIA